MSAFLAAILSFPTVVFTVLLGLFVLYAVATLLGLLDFDSLDGVLDTDIGAAGVPVTIVIGAISLVGWTTSYLGDRFLPDSTLIDLGIFAVATIVGVVAGLQIVRPLRGVFAEAEGPHRNQYVGKICTIRSLHVDGNAGTAEVGDVVAEVRCFRDNDLTLGSKAIVYDYDAKENTYHVGPIDPSIAT